MIRIVIIYNHRQSFQVLAKKKTGKKLLNNHNDSTTEEKF